MVTLIYGWLSGSHPGMSAAEHGLCLHWTEPSRPQHLPLASCLARRAPLPAAAPVPLSPAPCLLFSCPAAPLTAAGTFSTAAWLAASGTLSSASHPSWGCWGCSARSWRTPSVHPMSLTARSGLCPGCHSPLLSPVDMGRISTGTRPTPGPPKTLRGGPAYLPGYVFGEVAIR